MLDFTIEFICGLLIGLVFSPLLHYITYIQLCDLNQKLEIIIQAVESKIKVKSKSRKSLSERHYSFDIESLWKDFKTLFDMKSELDSDFSFNQVATQIRELRVAALTLKSFYQRKTNPRKRTLEAIQEWIDKNKEIENENVNNHEM